MNDCYPITRPVRVTEPTSAQEPLSVDEARKQCGIAAGNSYFDNDLSTLWIPSARRMVERDASIVCYTGSFAYKRTEFGWLDRFELPDIRPITAISSITYVDSTGTTQTWSSANYVLSTSAVMPYVRLAYGQVWPTVRGDGEGITVTLTAGYASVLAIPAEIKHAVRLAVHIQYLQNIEKFTEAERQQTAYDRLIAHIKRETYS